ncbi:MAG TPA: FAD-binding oxidoreductase [Acidobacteriaceae bacterium]
MTETSDDALIGGRWQRAIVVAVRPQTPTIKSFILAPQTPFPFESGQHVDVRLTAENGYTAVRSYSIGSSPSEFHRIELAIERLSDGEVSPFFHDVVAVGDEIELRGPLGGHFIWTAQDGGPLLLVGGGSGLVPLMSMIRSRQSAVGAVPAVLLLSARTWQDVLFRDELLDIEVGLSGFSFVLALTREQPRRRADYGRRIDERIVSDALQRLPGCPKIVFVCGNNPFVNAAAEGVLANGVPREKIRTERYGV